MRCAGAVLELVRGFSLDGFAHGALSDCTITLHAGMGVGQLSVLYVGGDNPRNEPAAEDATQPSILQAHRVGPGLGLDTLPAPGPDPEMALVGLGLRVMAARWEAPGSTPKPPPECRGPRRLCGGTAWR